MKFTLATIVFILVIPAIHFSCETQSNQEKAPAVLTLTTEQRLAAVEENLAELKAELTSEGSYDCCVRPACDWCLLHEGECECHANVKTGKDVCPGCGLGWHSGEGIINGIKASDVKWNIKHEHKEEGGHKH